METNYKIVDVFHQANSQRIHVLYTRTKQNVSCPFGAHGCTYKTLEQDLHQITMPLEPMLMSETTLDHDSNWIRSGINQNDYFYFKSNQYLILGNTQSQILELCTINEELIDEGCSSSWQFRGNESARKQIVMSDTGQTFLWNNTLFTSANLESVDLSEKPGYQRFIDGMDAMQEKDSTNTTVRLQLFDDQTLFAKATFASSADAPLGLIYSIPQDRISWVEKEFDHGEASVSVLAARQFQGEFYFLLNFFDFEDGTFNKSLDAYFMYTTLDQSLTATESPDYQDGEHIWDVANQALYKVSVTSQNALRIAEISVF